MKRNYTTQSVSLYDLSDTEAQLKSDQCRHLCTKTFQVKSNYVHRTVAGSEVLISIGDNIANFNGYIEMNCSAACLWEAMKEPKTAAQLEQILEEFFHIPHKQAAEDVLDFLKELQEHDMVLVQ